MRRYGPSTNGKRFVGNTDKKEVHDLDNEKTGASEFQIDEIINAIMRRHLIPTLLNRRTGKDMLGEIRAIKDKYGMRSIDSKRSNTG